MKRNWPHQSIQALFLEANSKGSVEITLPTPQDTHLFRFALYNAKRRNKKLQTPKFQSLRIQIDEIDPTKISIFKPIEIEIKKTGTE